MGERSSAGWDAALGPPPRAALTLPGTRLVVAEAVPCWKGFFPTPLGCSSADTRDSPRAGSRHGQREEKPLLLKKINTGSCQKHHDSGENKELWKFVINSLQLSRKSATCTKSRSGQGFTSPAQRGRRHPPSPRAARELCRATGTGKCSLCPLASPHTLPGSSETQSSAPTPCTSRFRDRVRAAR